MTKIVLFLLIHIFVSHASALLSKKTPNTLCSSKIYCDGHLLHTIQMSYAYNDSKTFVDMPTKFSEQVILQNLEKLGATPNKTQILEFLGENFHPRGYDLIQTEPTDWTQTPPYLALLDENEKNLIAFGNQLNKQWKNLLRRFDKGKLCNECASSAIVTNNSFIVPGGRFIEYYYWDTYWVIFAYSFWMSVRLSLRFQENRDT